MTTWTPDILTDKTRYTADVADGRRARRDRNRDSVVDGLLALYQEGNLDPSSDEIASKAGLSPRSLFRYFDDIDDLCQSAITRQLDRVRDLFELDIKAGAPLAERIVALVQQRVRLFDAVGPAGQVTRMRAPFQPLLAAELAHARTVLRSQIKRCMKTELSTMTATRAASTLAAVDVLCSFESYQLLRYDQSLNRAKSVAVLVDSLTTLLS